MSSPVIKNISLFQKRKSVGYPDPSRAHKEGRFAIVTERRRGMRWTDRCEQTKRAGPDGEGVWSCPPDAGVKLTEMFVSDGGNQSPVSEESRYKP